MKNYLKHKLRSKNPVIVILWVLLFGLLIVAFVAVFGWIFQYLWNWLMPSIFGLATISYWQAIGLLILSKIIFGGLGSEKDSKTCNDEKKGKQNTTTKDFSKWALYDAFWKEEGEAAFETYKKKTQASEHNDITE